MNVMYDYVVMPPVMIRKTFVMIAQTKHSSDCFLDLDQESIMRIMDS